MSLLSANLQAFQEIARRGTVHGAAEALGLTQTGVTQRIRSIEKELETTLFIRSRKGMTLTQEGFALLRYCQGAEELEGQIIDQILRGGSDKTINLNLIGPTSVLSSRVIDQCTPLYKVWPQLHLNFIFSDSIDRLDLVKTGKASLAIVPPDQVPNEMDSKVLKSDKYVLVASPKWQGRKLSEILKNERIIDFEKNDSTTQDYLKEYDLLNKVKRDRLYVNNNEGIIQLFSSGVGFGTLTKEIAAPFLKSKKLILLNRGAILDSPLALVWYPRPEMPKYFKDVISSIK